MKTIIDAFCNNKTLTNLLYRKNDWGLHILKLPTCTINNIRINRELILNKDGYIFFEIHEFLPNDFIIKHLTGLSAEYECGFKGKLMEQEFFIFDLNEKTNELFDRIIKFTNDIIEKYNE